MVSEAVANGDVAALNYFIADKYLKAFGQLAQSPNQKVLMLPIEATSVLGSLAGIGEIAKATFGGDRMAAADGKAPAPPRRPTVPSAGARRPDGDLRWTAIDRRGSFRSASGTGSSWRRCCSCWRSSRPAAS